MGFDNDSDSTNRTDAWPSASQSKQDGAKAFRRFVFAGHVEYGGGGCPTSSWRTTRIARRSDSDCRSTETASVANGVRVHAAQLTGCCDTPRYCQSSAASPVNLHCMSTPRSSASIALHLRAVREFASSVIAYRSRAAVHGCGAWQSTNGRS